MHSTYTILQSVYYRNLQPTDKVTISIESIGICNFTYPVCTYVLVYLYACTYVVDIALLYIVTRYTNVRVSFFRN